MKYSSAEIAEQISELGTVIDESPDIMLSATLWKTRHMLEDMKETRIKQEKEANNRRIEAIAAAQRGLTPQERAKNYRKKVAASKAKARARQDRKNKKKSEKYAALADETKKEIREAEKVRAQQRRDSKREVAVLAVDGEWWL